MASAIPARIIDRVYNGKARERELLAPEHDVHAHSTDRSFDFLG